MEVILLQDVDKVGKEGDTVKVKDGYARNYLLPKKIAIRCTKNALKALEARRKKKEKEAEKARQAAAELAGVISRTSITIPVESGANDVLFGSVTPEMILNVLRQEGIDIDKNSVIIKEPIKKLGIYTVEIKLHPEVKENLKVWVVKK